MGHKIENCKYELESQRKKIKLTFAEVNVSQVEQGKNLDYARINYDKYLMSIIWCHRLINKHVIFFELSCIVDKGDPLNLKNC